MGFWNGEVYKAVLDVRCRPDLDCVVFDGDWGLAIVRKRRNPLPLPLSSFSPAEGGGVREDASGITWEEAFTHADANFRLCKYDGLMRWLAEEDDECGEEDDEGEYGGNNG